MADGNMEQSHFANAGRTRSAVQPSLTAWLTNRSEQVLKAAELLITKPFGELLDANILTTCQLHLSCARACGQKLGTVDLHGVFWLLQHP